MPTTSPMRLRRAELEDATRLAEVHVTAWRETYTGIVDNAVLATFDVAERTQMWTRVLGPNRRQDTIIVVAENDGAIVGFAIGMPPRHETPARDWELATLYTVAAVHGTGVGSALLQAAVGERPAEIWLASDNNRAAAFYRKHGFAEDGETGFYDEWGIPEKRMVR